MAQPVGQARRRLWLYLAAAAIFAAIAARGLTVPLYAHDLGASRFVVGALFSVSTLAAAFLSLPSGVLVDRFGARTLIVVSLVLAGGSQLATAATHTVALLFLWQIIGGLAAGIQQSAVFSAVTESVDRSRRGRALGWLTFSMQSGFFLGPSVAGIALRWIDLRADIAITTALLILSIPGAVAAGNTTQRSGPGLAFREPLRALATQRAFMPVTVGLIAMTISWGTIGAFLPVFGRETLMLPSSQVGYLLAIQAVVNGGARIPAGWLVDRMPQRWPIVFLGGIGWSIVMVVLGHLVGFAAPAIALIIGTPFLAAAFVAVGVVFADLSSASTRGVTMGAYGSILFLGLAVGPLLFGPIVQGYGYAAGFTVCAAASVVLLGVMAAMQSERVRRRSSQAPEERVA
jgi:MFS transporter, DHA1 family, multidrug resistance protein